MYIRTINCILALRVFYKLVILLWCYPFPYQGTTEEGYSLKWMKLLLFAYIPIYRYVSMPLNGPDTCTSLLCVFLQFFFVFIRMCKKWDGKEKTSKRIESRKSVTKNIWTTEKGKSNGWKWKSYWNKVKK